MLNTNCKVKFLSLQELLDKYGGIPEYWQKLDITTEEMYEELLTHQWIVRDIMAPAEQTLLPDEVGYTALVQHETGLPYIVPCDDLYYLGYNDDNTYNIGEFVRLRDYDRYSYRAFNYAGFTEDDVAEMRSDCRNRFHLNDMRVGANGVLVYEVDAHGAFYHIPAFLFMGKSDAAEVEHRSTRRTCSRCDNTYSESEDDHSALPREDRDLCPSCRKRRYVTPYHRYAPHLNFHHTESDDNLYLGVELEVDNGGQRDAEAATILDIMNENENDFMVYCSRDGSLNNGIEIITAPATLNYHKTLKTKYKKLFKRLIRDGYRSHNTSTCGIHVHFSRAFFGENEEECVTKLLYLVERFWDEIVIFSRRDYTALEHFAKKTDTNPKDFMRIWNKTDNHDGRYFAVNITNTNTIELRMFRGTLNYDSFMAILYFVDSLARICKEKTNEELQSISFIELLPPEAKAYYDSRVATHQFDEV